MSTRTLPQLLTALGATPTEIADKLAVEGITGQINEPNSCAIAEYLKAHGFQDVNVGLSSGDDDYTPGYYVEVDGARAEHPIGEQGPIPDFIRAFDAGAYPHLVLERAS